MIIKKNDSFVNSNDELVVVTGKHFSDYSVSIYKYNEDTDEYDIHDSDTVYTPSEMKKLTGSREIIWDGDTE